MTNSHPMTKPEKLRRAAWLCWWMGALLTWNFLRTLVLISVTDPMLAAGIAAAAALGLQYVLTLVESTILSGLLPLPWKVSWERNSTEFCLSIAAFGCFLFDLLLNLGGTYTITQHLGTAMDNVADLGIGASIVKGIIFLATFFFAALFALGSELLEELANRYEGKHQSVSWSAQDMRDINRVSTHPRVQHLHIPPVSEPTLRRHHEPENRDSTTYVNSNRNPIDVLAQSIEERQSEQTRRTQKGKGL